MDHDVLVDEVQFSEGGKMQIPPKLDLNCKSKSRFGISGLDYVGIHIILDRKAGGSRPLPAI